MVKDYGFSLGHHHPWWTLASTMARGPAPRQRPPVQLAGHKVLSGDVNGLGARNPVEAREEMARWLMTS